MAPRLIGRWLRLEAMVKYVLLAPLDRGLGGRIDRSVSTVVLTRGGQRRHARLPRPPIDGQRAYGYLKKIVDDRAAHRRLRSQHSVSASWLPIISPSRAERSRNNRSGRCTR